MIKKFLISLGVIALFFVGMHRFLLSQAHTVDVLSSLCLYPFLVVQKIIVSPFTSWWHARSSYTELAHTLETFMVRAEDLQKQVIELNALLHYKNRTEELRTFAERYKTEKAVLAQVLFKSFSDQAPKGAQIEIDQPLHFFLLDAGKNKGIVPNMVVVYKNCLVGRVSEVYPYYSKVVLITDKLCKVAAFCAKNGVQGIHEGAHTIQSTRLTFVNHLEKVEEGDLILSSGEGLIFPRGFGLGHIKKCVSDSFHYTIEVEPLLDFSTLEYCYVVQKGGEFELIEEKNTAAVIDAAAVPLPPEEIKITP